MEQTFIDKMSWIVWTPFFLISMYCFFLTASVLLIPSVRETVEKDLEESKKKLRLHRVYYISFFFDWIRLQMLEHKILRYIIYAISPMGLLLIFYYGL